MGFDWLLMPMDESESTDNDMVKVSQSELNELRERLAELETRLDESESISEDFVARSEENERQISDLSGELDELQTQVEMNAKPPLDPPMGTRKEVVVIALLAFIGYMIVNQQFFFQFLTSAAMTVVLLMIYPELFS